ncbi:hypothetical protein [Bradyrhizobium sp. CCBAU 11357]|uniref:hypothetical protein n=1 Tax=Bradyrhizobium sp. CCBAU 11357 TaxID=1630808 RepID=UPI0023022383|nr:hypothetical protein [Bradyrhizobium sp. CCBAU 11357]
MLEPGALLCLAQLVVEGGNRFPGIALDQMLDGGIELVLQGVGDHDVLAGPLEAVAERLQAAVLPRDLPGGAGDQGEGKDRDGAGGDALRHRQAREPGGQVGDVVTERLLGKDCNDGEQGDPGKQEKQPHREFLTPAQSCVAIE